MATRPTKRGAGRGDVTVSAALRERGEKFARFRAELAKLGEALQADDLEAAAVHADAAKAIEADLRTTAPPRLAEFREGLLMMRAAIVAHAADLDRDIADGAAHAALAALERALSQVSAAQLAALTADLAARVIASALRELVPVIGPLALWHGWPETSFGPALAGIASDRMH
jgi:uncharacterized protein YcbX